MRNVSDLAADPSNQNSVNQTNEFDSQKSQSMVQIHIFFFEKCKFAKQLLQNVTRAEYKVRYILN
jgi:hypothetical protein